MRHSPTLSGGEDPYRRAGGPREIGGESIVRPYGGYPAKPHQGAVTKTDLVKELWGERGNMPETSRKHSWGDITTNGSVG